jgi:hypothetical protein
MCLLYESFGSNGFLTKVQPFPMDGHYRIDIISSVGHPRSDLVVPLVLCTVACNDWGTGIVLQIPRDNTKPVENWMKISGRPYMRVMTYKTLVFLALKYLGNYRR